MRYKLFLLLSTFVVVCFTAQETLSISNENTEAHLSDIIVTTSETHILLFAMLNNGFTDEMIQGLHSGIPVHFTFSVELYRSRNNWLDEQITALNFDHTLSYDTLKETYRVELDETSKKSFSFSTLADAQKTLNEVNGLKVIKLSDIIPDENYSLRIKAELYKKTLPMNLHEIVPFVSWWDFKTDWHTIEFTY